MQGIYFMMLSVHLQSSLIFHCGHRLLPVIPGVSLATKLHYLLCNSRQIDNKKQDLIPNPKSEWLISISAVRLI